MRVSALAGIVAVAVGCGGAHEPEAFPLDELRVGVDPRAEADAVAHALESAGFAVVHRVDSPRVTVLALARRAPLGTAVRVVTSRGVAWFADAGTGSELEAVSLLPLEHGAAPPDVDGDGEPEIVVLGRTANDPRACAVVLRIGRDDAVTPIRVDTTAIGPRVCIEDVADVDGDGRAEAVAVQRLPELSRGDAPTLALPLAIGVDGTAHLCRCQAYWADVRHRLDAELARARAAPDADAAYRVAVELALVAGRADDPTAAVAAFDEALAGVVLDEEQARAAARARDTLSAGLRARSP